MARRKKEKEVNITPKITRKELRRQRVLLIWAAVFVVYGFVFCYLPLGGWLMAFQNYKPKQAYFTANLSDLESSKSSSQIHSSTEYSEILWQWEH